jgi:hypothetical protein
MLHICKLTVAKTINQSSKPKAFTILTRTKHLNAHASTAVITKAMSTASNWGPRFGMAMMMLGGGIDACAGRGIEAPKSAQTGSLGDEHLLRI